MDNTISLIVHLLKKTRPRALHTAEEVVEVALGVPLLDVVESLFEAEPFDVVWEEEPEWEAWPEWDEEPEWEVPDWEVVESDCEVDVTVVLDTVMVVVGPPVEGE